MDDSSAVLWSNKSVKHQYTMASCIIPMLFSFLQHPMSTKTSIPMEKKTTTKQSVPAWNNGLSAILLKLNPAQIPQKKKQKNICLASKHMCNILLSKENSRKSIKIRQPVSGVYTAAGFYLLLLMCRHGATQQLQGRHKGSSRSNTLCENMEDHNLFPLSCTSNFIKVLLENISSMCKTFSKI